MINYIGQFKREKINTVIRSAIKRNKNIYTFLLFLPAIIYLLFYKGIIEYRYVNVVSPEKQATALLINGEAKGTAFLVSDKGLLLTARHCVDKLYSNDETVTISFKKIDDPRFQNLKAKVIYLPKDEKDDYAVIKLVKKLPDVPKIAILKVAGKIKNPENYNPEVIIIGYPGSNMTQTYLSNTVRDYSGVQFEDFDGTLFQTNDIQRGMSGGPVIDKKTGEVIGIVSLVYEAGVMEGVGLHEKIQQVFNDPDASHIDW